LDTLLATAPDAAGARLVVNALLASGTTRGGGRLELGGAAARIGNVEVADLPVPVPPPIDGGDTPAAFAPPLATGAVAAPAPPVRSSSASRSSPCSSWPWATSSVSAGPPAPRPGKDPVDPRSRAQRLILRGYGPLVGLVVVLVFLTMLVPSRPLSTVTLSGA